MQVKKIISFIILSILFYYNQGYPSIESADARSVFIQTDGNVVAAGTLTDSDSGIEFAAARYLTSNGALDNFFGIAGTGIVDTAIGTRAEANSAALQSNDQIVLSGFIIDIDAITKSTTVRYNSDGTLDTAFGGGGTGIVITQVGDGSQLTKVVVQPDQQILAIGTAAINGQLKSLLIRYNTDGSYDTSFNGSGIVTTTVGYHTAGAGVALQSDNKIIVAGYSVINSVRQVMLTRYNTDGSVDTSYGTSGSVTLPVGASSSANSIVIDGSGFAVIAGTSDNQFLVARFDTTGTPDTSFGNNGVVVTPIGNAAQANDLAIQTDGNIVVVGTSDDQFALARYTPVGALDNSFGANGIVTSVIEGDDIAKAIAIQSDGKLVVAGLANTDFAVTRYTTLGVLDNSWGNNGVVAIPGGSKTLGTIITDQKPTGTAGGTFLSGSWNTRDLNTLSSTNSSVSLSSNQFILQQGVYEISAYAPAYLVNNHKIRLQNITAGTTEVLGTSSFSSSTLGTVNYSYLEANLSVSNPTTYEIQHQCSTTRNTDGFGVASNIGASETYTTVRIVQK